MGLSKNMVITPKFRTMYPALFEPTRFKDLPNSPLKYQVEAVFDEDTDLRELKAKIDQAVKEKWGNRVPVDLNDTLRPGSDRSIQREDGSIAQNPVYSGKTFCKFASLYPVAVVDSKKLPVSDQSLIYPGVYGRAIVTIRAYDLAGNRGVGMFLNVYQLIGGGERVIQDITEFLPDDLGGEISSGYDDCPF
jgi:hypothetical protein